MVGYLNKGVAGSTYNLNTDLYGDTFITNVNDADVRTFYAHDHPTISPKSLHGMAGPGYRKSVWTEASRLDGVSWNDTVGTNHMTYVGQPLQDYHFNLPGVAGNYLTLPDSAALDLVGSSMEISARIALNWMPGATNRQVILSKRNASNVGSYQFALEYLSSSHGILTFSHSSATNSFVDWIIPAINGETLWVKVTWASGIAKYWIAPDSATEPITWHQIGSDRSLIGTTVANTELVTVGGTAQAGTACNGRLYRVITRSSIGGTVVLDVNVPVNCGVGVTPDVTTTFTATTGGIVTIVKTGTPPATCRLVTTVANLPQPWYEITYPSLFDAATADNDGLGSVLLWAKIQVGAWPSVATTGTLTPVSCMGMPTGNPSFGLQTGWAWYIEPSIRKTAIVYNLSTGGVGGFFGTMPGLDPAINWNSTLPVTTAETQFQNFIQHDVGNLYNPQIINHSWLDSTTVYGNITSYLKLTPPTYKLRFLAWDTPASLNFLEVGMITMQNPAKKTSAGSTPIDAALHDTRRAINNIPSWLNGESILVRNAGVSFTGQTVVKGDVVASTSADGTAEGSVVWAKTAPYYSGGLPSWSTIRDRRIPVLSNGPNVGANENFMLWTVLSSSNGAGYYRDYFDIDGPDDSYIYMGGDTKSANVEIFFELDSSNGTWQGGYITGTGIGPISGPILIVMWTERQGANTKLFGWSDIVPNTIFDGQDNDPTWSATGFNLTPQKLKVPLAPPFGARILGWGFNVSPNNFIVSTRLLSTMKNRVVSRVL